MSAGQERQTPRSENEENVAKDDDTSGVSPADPLLAGAVTVVLYFALPDAWSVPAMGIGAIVTAILLVLLLRSR